MLLNLDKTTDFQLCIWEFYHMYGRSFAWRNVQDPYKVVVSEIMLQQTQTYRVESKYDDFMQDFPDFLSLADASLKDVLSVWQGLGYNRRGMYLHTIAKKVIDEYQGQLPDQPEILETFPGIGKATAASICTFAFNKPTFFIETNIRAVFIHMFFKDKNMVDDKEILPLVSATLDYKNPREWYYALMDYGVMLKKKHINPSRKSKHHVQQSKFEGSDRQIRGNIIKLLTQNDCLSKSYICQSLEKNHLRVEKIVIQLCNDGLIKIEDDKLMIV